jgi:hypothetical protein
MDAILWIVVYTRNLPNRVSLNEIQIEAKKNNMLLVLYLFKITKRILNYQ